jgi:hypothetical protein
MVADEGRTCRPRPRDGECVVRLRLLVLAVFVAAVVFLVLAVRGVGSEPPPRVDEAPTPPPARRPSSCREGQRGTPQVAVLRDSRQHRRYLNAHRRIRQLTRTCATAHRRATINLACAIEVMVRHAVTRRARCQVRTASVPSNPSDVGRCTNSSRRRGPAHRSVPRRSGRRTRRRSRPDGCKRTGAVASGCVDERPPESLTART